MQNHCFCNQKSDPYSQIIMPILQYKNHPIFQPSDIQFLTKFATFSNLKPTFHSPPNSSFSGVLKNSLWQENCRFHDKVKKWWAVQRYKVTSKWGIANHRSLSSSQYSCALRASKWVSEVEIKISFFPYFFSPLFGEKKMMNKLNYFTIFTKM